MNVRRPANPPHALRAPTSIVLAVATALVAILYGLALGQAAPLLILIAAPIACAVVVLALLRPELAAIALLAITWGYLSDIGIKYHGTPSVAKPLALVLVAALAYRRFAGRRTPFVHDPITWLMIGHLVILSLGVWYAAYPDASLALAVDFAKDLVLFLALVNLITSVASFERCLWLLLAFGALFGTLTVYQEITHSYDNNFGGLAQMTIAQIREGLQDRPRAAGPIGDPNYYGQQLVTVVPIGLWALRHARTPWARLGGAYATLAVLAGIGLSFSRGAYLALAVALILCAFSFRPKPRHLLMLLPVVGALLWFAPSELTARFTTFEAFLPGSAGVRSEGSLNRRSVEMQMALNMFADRPLLGVGGRNYPYLYPDYIRKAGSPVPDEQREAHNFYLEIAAEHGLLGLATVGSILLLVWRRLRWAGRRFAEVGNRRMGDMANALQAGLAGYLLSAMFLHGAYPRILWLQIGMAVALAVIARRTTGQLGQRDGASRAR